MKKTHRFMIIILCLALLLGAFSPVTAEAKTGKSSSGTVTGRSTEQIIFSYLTGTMGLNSAAACGIMANVYKECSFNEKASGSSSYGICQWYDGENARNFTLLQNYCSSMGFNYQELTAQLHFLEHDLENRYSSLLNSLRLVADTADGAYKAGYMFCYHYERPDSYQTASVTRGNLAKDTFYPVYAGQSSGSFADLGSSFSATLVNVGNKKLVSISSSGSAVGMEENGSASQNWTFTRKAEGKNPCYTIKNEENGKFLAVRNSSDENGTDVVLSSDGTAPNARFYIMQRSGAYYLQAVSCSNTVLTMVSSNHFNVQIEAMGENLTSQQFRILYDGKSSASHKLVSVITPATMEHAGKIEQVCTVCGDKDDEERPIARIAKVSLSTDRFTYDGKNKTPKVTVKDAAGRLISSSNYSVSYPSKRNQVGEYEVKIVFTSHYSGKTSLSFTIEPKASEADSLHMLGKVLYVKWEQKEMEISGYQLQYAPDLSFSGEKVQNIYTTDLSGWQSMGAEDASYLRIRVYKLVMFKGRITRLYSNWGEVRRVQG